MISVTCGRHPSERLPGRATLALPLPHAYSGDMSIALRLARPDDAPRIHELVVSLATYEREPDAVEATPESIRAQLESPHPPFECLLAERDGRAVGFALFFQSYSTWRGRPGITLEDLFVEPEARRSGAGRALLVRLARIAAERGCARMEWAVLDWNELAQRFYEGLGARPLRGWTTWRLTGEALERLALE